MLILIIYLQIFTQFLLITRICRTGNVTIQKRKNDYIKIKVIALIIIFDDTNPFEICKCKPKNWATVSEALVCLTVAQVDLFDSPCLQSEHCQYLEKRKNRLDV